MKQRYLTSLLLGMMALGATAQTQFTVLEDMTSKLQNANFKSGSPVANTVRTYDYDMEDDGAANGGVGLFGQQPVEGWTAAAPTDNAKVSTDNSSGARTDGLNARAAGIFAYDLDSQTGLGGEYYPRIEGGDTQGLGMVAVWGANLVYSQHVSLPAGDYLLIAKVCNVAGTGEVSNNFGFKVDDETYYRSKMNSFPQQDVLEGEGKDCWVEDTVIFRLAAAVEGDVLIGYSFGAGSGSAPHLFVDNVRLLKVDPSGLDQQQIAEAKETLKELIDEGKRLHVDTSESETVYNNASATLAQVEAAIEKQKALNDEAITDLSEFFIMNPHFSMDDPITDGICTYDYDMEKNGVTHYGMQPVKSWVASNPSQNQVVGNEDIQGRACGVLETGTSAWIGGTQFTPPATLSDGTTGKLLGFVTCWSKTTQYTQHVILPAGSYTLTISYYNSGGANAVAKNLIGFISDDGDEYLGETLSFPVGQWGKETIAFTLDAETEGVFSLGYTATNSGSGSMPHFFLDGISLFYEGELEFDPSLFALQGVVNDAENYVYEVFYSGLKSELESAISEGRSLVSSQSSDAAANKAAQEKITALIQDVKNSIADYERLQKFYDETLEPAITKYSEQSAILNKLEELESEVEDVLGSGEWDKATIDEKIASLPIILKEETQKAWNDAIASGTQLSDDLDISPLFDTLGVTYSTEEKKGNDVPDKQWIYGSASNFKTQYGTAEVWKQSPFTVSQTLTNLPAGTYTISTKAFYRTASNANNYANYDSTDQRAFIFAGNSRAPLTNVVELAATEQLEGYSNDDLGGIFVPNSQKAAYNVFNDPTLAAKVTAKTATVLTETGDLTFGITADQLEDDCWVVWYTFEIAYNAVDETVFNDELQALIRRAEETRDDDENLAVRYVTGVRTALSGAISSGKTALNGSVDDKRQAMKDILNAIDSADKGNVLVTDYTDKANAISDLINGSASYADIADDENDMWNNILSSQLRITDMIEEVANETMTFRDIDAIQKGIGDLDVALAEYVLGRDDFDEGSLENPINITGVIINYAFHQNADNWTIVGSDENGRIGQNQGYQGASYNNEEDGYAVNHFIEAWRPDGAVLSDGTISQTLLVTLPKGFYRLTCDGYATNQSNIPEGGIQGVGLYAQNGNGWLWTSMAIDVTAGKPQRFERDFYADGTSKTVVGVRVTDTNASWVAADNFRLYYIGQDAPDAIESVGSDVNAPTEVYNLQGIKTNATQRGLYIMVRDGKAQKVLVK